MSRRYTLVPITPPPRVGQSSETIGFIGGRPKLPAAQGILTCGLCGASQTFYLQVAFPDRHEWAGLTLAIFQFTSCHDPKRMMPHLSYGPRSPGEDIPDGALDGDKTSYRFLVFRTVEGVVREEYEERILHLPIELTTKAPAVKTTSHIGGKPRWLQEDWSPGSYEGEPLTFLLQWEQWFAFRAVPGAPRQYSPSDAAHGDRPRANNYTLFASYELYLFGNHAWGKTHIHAALQST